MRVIILRQSFIEGIDNFWQPSVSMAVASHTQAMQLARQVFLNFLVASISAKCTAI